MAEPGYRDKLTGKTISKDQILILESQKKKKELKSALKQEAEGISEELEKPFARNARDDPDELGKMLKERES